MLHYFLFKIKNMNAYIIYGTELNVQYVTKEYF